MPPRVHVESDVDGDHDDAGDVETDGGRHDSVDGVEVKDAQLRVRRGILAGLGLVPAQVRGHEGDEGGEDPHRADEHHRLPRRHPRLVAQRVLDVHVAVQGDHAQVQDGGRRAHDVRGDPDAAEDGAEDPPAVDVVGDGEGHDYQRHQQVGDSQRHDEEVGVPLQAAVGEDGGTDKEVAHDRHEDHDRQHGSDHRLLGHAVSLLLPQVSSPVGRRDQVRHVPSRGVDAVGGVRHVTGHAEQRDGLTG